MPKKSWVAALVGGWLGLSAVAPAQQLPTSVGAARLPEPLSYKPTQPPPKNLVPGPMSPLMAPPGPPAELALPADHSSAFQAENYATHDHWFLHVGTIALQRQRLGNATLSFADTTPRPPFPPPDLDMGIPREAGQGPPSLDFVANNHNPNDIGQHLQFGVYASVGYMGQSSALEVSAFAIPDSDTNNTTSAFRQVNGVFINPPPGFEGDAGLFRQGDFIQTTQKTLMAGAEMNVRWFDRATTGIEPMVGVRYLYVQDRFNLFFIDNLRLNPVAPIPRALNAVNYSSRVVHNFVGPEVGFEYQWNLFGWQGVVVGLNAKSALGVDSADVTVALRREDGLVAFRSDRSRHSFAAVSEIAAFLDVYLLERFRLRGGYHMLFLNNFPEAVDQISLDLSQPQGRIDNTGHIFFHGPSVQFQLLF